VRVRVIMNPRAGVRVPGLREAVEQGRPGWRDYAVFLTREAGHATELAREALAGGADVVIAVGGDGTVNEVARALLGSPAALGIVPAGSGNGLARALRLPLRPDRALAALESAVCRPIDIGLLDGRPFLNVAGIGFDAAVGHAFHEHGRRGGRRGLLGYVRLSLRELRRYRPQRLTVEADGHERIVSAPFVLTFANGPQYGSGAVINPGGKLDDGRLELVTFEIGPVLELLAAAPRLFTGGLDRSPRYRRLATTRAVVTAEAPFLVHMDGDPSAAVDRVTLELRPRALRLLAPAATVADPRGPFASGPSPAAGEGV
jgi:diacylglycerol kinase (ATP)